jgi:Sec-independent protein translocase protein TatA
MDGIFGVGPLEILLVLVLALIFLGPQDMVKTARQLGRTLYRLYHSPVWRQIMSTQQELRDLPTKFVREAGLENTLADLKKSQAEIRADLRQVTSAANAELTAATQEMRAQISQPFQPSPPHGNSGAANAELTAAAQDIKINPPTPIPSAPLAAELPAAPQDANSLPPSPPPPSESDEPDNFSI